MRLLSPQTVAQQTNLSTDGFLAKGLQGTLTFSGFTKTIFYHRNPNLPIFFTAPNLSDSSPHLSLIQIS
ncbi:MAG: hypothetical protein ACK53Y_25115, partial [bacterium]